MGTITKIRQIAPWVFVVFAVLFVGFMILSDNISSLATSGGESMRTAAIGTVNGEKIYYKDFEELVKIRIEQMRNDPQNEGKEIDEQQVRSQVWDEMLNDELMKQAAEKLGVVVTKDEILDIFIENPPEYLARSFTDSAGVFNRELYLKILNNPNEIVNYLGADPTTIPQETKQQYISDFSKQIKAIDDYLRLQKMNTEIALSLNAAYAVSSPTYVTEKFIADNSSADINYLYIPAGNPNDTTIKVTDAEIKAYYDKHKSMFKVKDERKVKYIVFPVVPSSADSVRMQRRIKNLEDSLNIANTQAEKDSVFSLFVNAYQGTESDWTMIQDLPPQIMSIFANAVKGEIIGPVAMPDGTHFYRLDGKRSGTNEVVKASHILISFGNNKDSAKAVATNLMKKVNKSNFASLALQTSEDKGSAQQGGDLGYFSKGRMVPEFEKAAFGASVGSIVGPVESQFGYHIIYVTDKKSEELKYSEIALQVATTNETKNKIKRDAFAALRQIQDGKDIDALAAKLKLQSAEYPFVTRDKPIFGSSYLTSRLFVAKKVGDVLDTLPREIQQGAAIVVGQVAAIREAGIGNVTDADVRKTIETKIRKQKQLDVVAKIAEGVYDGVKLNGTLEGITNLPEGMELKTATIKNNGIITGMPTEFVAVTKIFKLPENKINKPIRGESGYFIVEVKNKVVPPASAAKDATDATRAQYTRSLFDIWFANFKEKSDIEDNRGKYFQEF